MAYFESITAGRGGLDSFNNALNNQRYANLVLNESMGNFANTIANAGSAFDNAKIREEALKYQKMRDLANDKQKAEAFELQKRQAEQSMEFAQRNQAMNEQAHKQNLELGKLRNKELTQSIERAKKEFTWLLNTKAPSAKASVAVGNNAMKPAPTQNTNTLNTQSTPINKPKTITKEEFIKDYAKPMFRN